MARKKEKGSTTQTTVVEEKKNVYRNASNDKYPVIYEEYEVRTDLFVSPRKPGTYAKASILRRIYQYVYLKFFQFAIMWGFAPLSRNEKRSFLFVILITMAWCSYYFYQQWIQSQHLDNLFISSDHDYSTYAT